LLDLVAPCNILILQHPSEQKKPLASVPVLQHCLSPLQVLVGEDFSQHPLVTELLQKRSGCRVLFPVNNCALWTVGQRAQPQEKIDTLIVLDGTWRKAKKIWYLNEWLQNLPAVKLAGTPPSQYRIRSSSVAGGVSTLEAIALACNYIEGSTRFAQLCVPFNAMIDMQIKKMGAEKYHANYHQL
jgi:DTW domain-containing protein YfiP